MGTCSSQDDYYNDYYRRWGSYYNRGPYGGYGGYSSGPRYIGSSPMYGGPMYGGPMGPTMSSMGGPMVPSSGYMSGGQPMMTSGTFSGGDVMGRGGMPPGAGFTR